MMPAFSLRAPAVGAVAVLIVTGLVAIDATTTPRAHAASELPGAETFVVSRSDEGESGNAFLTADAQRVVFTSDAADLVPGDANGVRDVFLTTAAQGSGDPFSRAALLVSVPDGTIGSARSDGWSDEAVSSMDGRFVAFTSVATNLVDEPSAGGRHVYVRDTVANTTIRIQGSALPNGDSYAPDLSDDGRRLVFTSDADNYVADGGDLNSTADVFIAELDADRDGTIGDLIITKVVPDAQVFAGTHSGVISGNGSFVAFLSRSTLDGATALTPRDTLFAVDLGRGTALRLGENVAGAPSIDATGGALAYIRADACGDGFDAPVAVMHQGGSYTVAVGTIMVDRRSGWVRDAQISPDGSTVAWTTTVPAYDMDAGGLPSPALAQSVVRAQAVGWSDAVGGVGDDPVQCAGIAPTDWYDVATGSGASLSASGRTIAMQTPTPGSILAVDTHASDGITVSSTQGTVSTPSFITQVPISGIPLTTLRGYAAALANAPIHRLPIHRLPIHRLPIHRLPIHRLLIEDSPIHRLPIHRLPIHRLPLHRLDLPGGWDQVLVGSPFEGQLTQTVTLDEVLTWAEANPETTAGALIRSLTLVDVDVDGSGLDALSLAAYVLGDAPVAELPIGDDGDDPSTAWQRLVTAQGLVNAERLALQVDSVTALADLDAAGLDIAASGVEDLALGDLPDSTLSRTLLGWLSIDPALLPGTPLGERDVETLDAAARTALFGTADVTGTLAEPSAPLEDDATFADLAAGTPGLTLGELLFSFLDAESYPWEQLEASAIDPRIATDVSGVGGCDEVTRCSTNAPFRFVFDVGPGEPLLFEAPTASVTLPTGTVSTQIFAAGSGPDASWNAVSEYAGSTIVNGRLVTVPMPDTVAGTVFEVDAWFSEAVHVGDTLATAKLTTGSLTAESSLFRESELWAWDDPDHNMSASNIESGEGVVLREGMLYYEWISPAFLGFDEDTLTPVPGPADDEDLYFVEPPAPGKRLVVSTNATDGQISLSLYSAKKAVDAASLGVENAGPVPGILVAEQNGPAGESSTAGADVAGAIGGQTLIDQASQRGAGTASVEAAGADAAGARNLVVRVTSGNGKASSSMYSLRVRYIDEPVETVCTAWSAAVPGMPVEPGVSDPVADDTNTIYLFDTKRFRDTHGIEATETVRAALASISAASTLGTGTSRGAVLSVDSDPDVAAARATLDANPCSLTARESLTARINTFASRSIGDRRDQIESVVVVGGDDIIPFAPVAQHTGQFSESSHADDLRLTGSACPAEVAEGQLDVCATPLSAAAAEGHILTDDPYGLATAYESLGGHLYVPSVALGRLVDSPTQILDMIQRYLDAGGVLAANSSLTAGYGAWSELPDRVTSALAWRSPANKTLGDDGGTWTATDMSGALLPADDPSPRVVSLNTHADERRMLPGITGAPEGRFSDGDLFTTDSVADRDRLGGSLVFLIGCHAGNNLPSAYYGADADDWADVFSSAGGYVGNTGYGLANSVTTALSERLLELYSDWLGVDVDGRTVTASEALTYAKQSYLGGLGLYSGYDEKVLMQAVYYGLPMYTLSGTGTSKQAPVPQIPDDLEELRTTAGLSSAALHLAPSFRKITTQDAAGNAVSYLVADDQAPAVVPGQPVLPKIVTQLRPEAGLTPRGVLITSLSSQAETGVSVAITEPGVGVPETTAQRTNVAFPSSFAAITTQDTPAGPIDLLVVTPGRVESADGVTGTLERFTQLGLDVVHGDSDSTDASPPLVSAIEAQGGTFRFTVKDLGSAVRRAVLLVQPTPADPTTETPWQPIDAVISASGSGSVALPEMTGSFRWILQVADAAGNVVVETSRGHLDRAQASPPELGSSGGDTTVTAGSTLHRGIEVTDAAAGERLTARLTLRGADASATQGDASVPVMTGDDGTTRAFIAQKFETPGDYTATLEVCRGTQCSSTSFAVRVPLPDTAPRSSVTLTSDTEPVGPRSVLTATATGSDAEGADVSFRYEWRRDGMPVNASGKTLALADYDVGPGAVISITVYPWDGAIEGHASSASVTLATPPPPPAIAATATTAAGPYAEGTWSRTPVTVAFACSGAISVQCSEPQTVSTDTTAAGIVVTGTARDLFGRTATVDVLVRVDGTAPTLAPVVTPNPVAQGAAAAVLHNAADAASGIATASCATPQTAVAGPSTVACEATDVAGNRATAAAAYTVQAPGARLCRGVLDRTALAPLNADGSSVYLRTSGVPITFRACDAAGKSIATKNLVKSVTLLSTTSLPSGAKINELWTPPLTGFAYLKAADVWFGQISTVKLAGGKKYTYRVLLTDGSSFTFTFGVR